MRIQLYSCKLNSNVFFFWGVLFFHQKILGKQMDRPFNHMSGATGKPLGPRTLDIAKHHLHQPLVSPWLGEANQKQKKNNFTEKKQLLTWVLTLYIFKCCWQFQFHCPIFCIKQLEASCLAVGKLLATKGTGVLTNKKQYLFCLT